ncbi:hypothetical protein MA16_Dca002235 [Dendrobium catenatum]|uniref:Uncharacterized protein n=1 Tax=Dendrobium catenatum TaxID=906689 RepID=A0A2I0VZZ1_9ASPA|nr:hypothetical protein MA16_Dca002235 [Dendrobium catenatum]
MRQNKRFYDNDVRKSKHPKRRAEKEKLSSILDKHYGKTDKIIEKIDKIYPYTTIECIAKLGSIENISMKVIIDIHEALIDSNDHKIALITLDGTLLRGLIEYILHITLNFLNAQLGCQIYMS